MPGVIIQLSRTATCYHFSGCGKILMDLPHSIKQLAFRESSVQTLKNSCWEKPDLDGRTIFCFRRLRIAVPENCPRPTGSYLAAPVTRLDLSLL